MGCGGRGMMVGLGLGLTLGRGVGEGHTGGGGCRSGQEQARGGGSCMSSNSESYACGVVQDGAHRTPHIHASGKMDGPQSLMS